MYCPFWPNISYRFIPLAMPSSRKIHVLIQLVFKAYLEFLEYVRITKKREKILSGD